MKRIQPPVVPTTLDRQTALDRAKDELTESLRGCGDAATVAVVIRFLDQMREITQRVLFRGYSAESFAFGRVATELDAAARRAGLRLPEAPVVEPAPDQIAEDNPQLFG